jgi:hypothetical protein
MTLMVFAFLGEVSVFVSEEELAAKMNTALSALYISQNMQTVSNVPVEPKILFGRVCERCDELVDTALRKFPGVPDKRGKYLILTSIPTSVTIKSIVDRFKCSQYMAKTASKLRNKSGAVTEPEQ